MVWFIYIYTHIYIWPRAKIPFPNCLPWRPGPAGRVRRPGAPQPPTHFPWYPHMSIDIHGNPLISLDIHRYPWECKEIYGFPYISFDVHGYRWIAMEIQRYPWISADVRGYPWISFGFHRYPWISIEIINIHGYSVISMDFQAFPLISMISMNINRNPWISMDINWYPFISLDFHWISQHGYPYISMDFQWCFIDVSMIFQRVFKNRYRTLTGRLRDAYGPPASQLSTHPKPRMPIWHPRLGSAF